MISKDKVRNDLVTLLGSKRVLTDKEAMLPWAHDWTDVFEPNPLAIVFPESTEEVSFLLKYASKNKISVVTIVKNGLPFIKSAIKSFNLQNYPNKELIIVYGKSTDGTEEFLKSIEQNNITIKQDIKSNNRYAAINLGIKNMTGDIFGILHSDDIFFSENTLSIIAKNMNLYDW